ncbi:MAG: hypothetical protein AAF220_13935 [Pseudomonadota bacterium]
MEQERLIELLAKCLELSGSDVDGEALAASRRANAIRGRLGLTWKEALTSSLQHSHHLAEPEHRHQPFGLHAEVSKLQTRVAELQAELKVARASPRRQSAVEEENALLRAALDESHRESDQREQKLRKQLREVLTMLTQEQERAQQASARVAALQDMLSGSDHRIAEANRDSQLHHDRARALERSLSEFLAREVTLRHEIEEIKRERDYLQAAESRARRVLGRYPLIPGLGRAGRLNAAGAATVGEPANEGGPSNDVETVQEDGALADTRGGALIPGLPVFNANGRYTIVEIKPLSRLFIYTTLRRALAAITFARETGADYVIASASGVTLGTLFRHEVDTEARDAVLRRIDETGEVSWDAYQGLRDEFGLKTVQTGAIVLQNDLQFSRNSVAAGFGSLARAIWSGPVGWPGIVELTAIG